MAAMFGCCTMTCMSGLSGSSRDCDSLPPKAAMDSCNFSSFGTVIGNGSGLSSCTTVIISLPVSGKLSKFLFFTGNFGVTGVLVVMEGEGWRDGGTGVREMEVLSDKDGASFLSFFAGDPLILPGL